MIGMKRLDNLQFCVTDLVSNQVKGDLIEAGVWRGGASIFMKAVLMVLGDKERRVYLADSFEGVPEPDIKNIPWIGAKTSIRINSYLFLWRQSRRISKCTGCLTTKWSFYRDGSKTHCQGHQWTNLP